MKKVFKKSDPRQSTSLFFCKKKYQKNQLFSRNLSLKGNVGFGACFEAGFWKRVGDSHEIAGFGGGFWKRVGDFHEIGENSKPRVFGVQTVWAFFR